MSIPKLTRTFAGLTLAAGVAAAGVGGCEDSGEDDVGDAAASIEQAGAEYEEAAEEYADEAADELGEAREELAETAERLREQSERALTELGGAELAEQVRLRLARAEEAVESGRFDDADAILSEVKAVESRLPEEIAAQIESVRALVQKGQSAQESAEKVRDLGGALPGGE